MDGLEQFRKDKDELFGKGEESPLTSTQKGAFKGLNYYPPNPNLVFRNLTIESSGEDSLVQIKTSSGDMQAFKNLGEINFDIDGKPCRLTVYESTNEAGLFLPFRDETNRGETYHEGRYVEVELEGGAIKELDFNYAYNPYCAYNDGFRCPITPKENTLPVEITAGEKRFR